MANAITNKAKYSAGPNSKATLTNKGANKTKPNVAMNAPTKEAKPDNVKASPARPCKVIG